MEEKPKKRKLNPAKWILLAALVLNLCLMVYEYWVEPWMNENIGIEVSEEVEYLESKLAYQDEKERMTAGLGEGYDKVYPLKVDSMVCVAKKEGKWGIVTVTGDMLEPFEYDRYSYLDNTGWVELEKDGRFYVFNEEGVLQKSYTDKLEFRQESEEAYLYRTAKAYMGGMEITTTIPEILEDDYYGVSYRSFDTGEVLYEALGDTYEAGVFTFPDESGMAVAIQGDAVENRIYYITAEVCESRELELPEGVNARRYYFLGDYTWADFSLSNEWIKVYVVDAVPGFLIDDYVGYSAFLNVNTLELVKFPEQYQTEYMMYSRGYGDAMAICAYNEGQDYYKYAICKGDKVLTEEKYYWVNFDKNYIIAGSEMVVEILDYEGNVLTQYEDAGGAFVNGKMIVCDSKGVFFIDESLQRCSDYIVTGAVDGCFLRGIVVDDKYYFISEFAE